MKEQDQFDNLSNYAARLSEERRRVHPHQGEFAGLLGISQGRQSLYERGERELRAPYLESAAHSGLDVLYILTGERCENRLNAEATELVNLFLDLPTPYRTALLEYVRSFAGAYRRIEAGEV